MIAALLCMAALSTQPAPQSLRACALAQEAADAYPESPALMLAIAGVETGWRPWAVGSLGELGAWQTLPRYGDGSAVSAARILRRWVERGGLVRGVAGYNAGNRGLRGLAGRGYAARVLSLARRLGLDR